MAFWLRGLHRVSFLPSWGRARFWLQAVLSVRISYGLGGLCVLWLLACGDLGEAYALSTRSIMHWTMAWRTAVDATTHFLHELIHGETGKSGPLWGLKAPLFKFVIHGGFGGRFMEVWVRFMEVWIHGGFSVRGARNTVPPCTGTPTPSPSQDLENPKD